MGPVDQSIPVMLRQRINELMVANADLEKEVVRLRYAHSAMVEAEERRDDLRSSRDDLQRAKESLNDVTSENQQLKIVIGKTRYGHPPAAAASQGDTHEHSEEQEEPLEQPLLEPENDFHPSLSWEQKFDEKIDSVLKSIPAKVVPAGKKFVKGANKIVNKLEASFSKGLAKASQFLETQLGEDPLAWKDKQLNKLEKGLGKLLDDFAIFDTTLLRQPDEPEAKSHHKCPNTDENNNNLGDNSECSSSQKPNKGDENYPRREVKNNNKKEGGKNKFKDAKKDKNYHKSQQKKEAKKFKKENNSTDTAHEVEVDKKWMFGRAKYREEYRNEDRKSDWIFERASNRKKFHKLTDAEWYEKKLKNKDCDGQSCEDLTEMNPGSQNHGKKSKSHHNNEKRNKKYEDGGEGEYKKYDKKKAKDGVYEKKSKNKDCDGQSCKDWTEVKVESNTISK